MDRRGIEVAYLLRRGGGRAATVLGHPDGMLVPGLELRRDIARAVRGFRPDAVVTANFDLEAYGGINHADHRAAGLAVVDGVRDADNTWVFRELADEGLAAWHTRWILVAGHPAPTHGIPLDETDVAAGVTSLRCHAAYLADLPGHPDPGVFIPEILRQGGTATGVPYAACVRAVDLGQPMR